MRTCKLYIAVSIDGYIAREDGRVDWLRGDSDYGYDAFIEGIDTIIMGGKTYDQVRTFGAWPYGGMQTIVYSRRRAGTHDAQAVFTDEDPRLLLQRLREEDGKDIWLVGGGEILRMFMEMDLIDEYQVFVHSIVLGSGIPLFPTGTAETRLRLQEARRLDRDFVQLTYSRSPADEDAHGAGD